MNPYRHEDERRVLIEWVKDYPLRSCKVVIAKDRLPLGKHYHQNKDEIFYLLKGKGVVTLTTAKKTRRDWLFEGESVFIPRGTAHTFLLYPDSILLGGATAPFDPNDEIPIVD